MNRCGRYGTGCEVLLWLRQVIETLLVRGVLSLQWGCLPLIIKSVLAVSIWQLRFLTRFLLPNFLAVSFHLANRPISHRTPIY